MRRGSPGCGKAESSQHSKQACGSGSTRLYTQQDDPFGRPQAQHKGYMTMAAPLAWSALIK